MDGSGPRQLLAPRWVGLHVLAVVLVVTFVLLGCWQLGRVQDMLRPVTDDDPAPVALTTLSGPTGLLQDDAVGRRVVVEGTYDDAHGFVVPGRSEGGRDGEWVVGLLRLADGSGVLVLRGWAPTGTDVGPAGPTGSAVEVAGRLAVSESPDGGLAAGVRLPPGQLPAVNPVNLLDTVDYPVHDGYLVVSGQTPADPAAARLVAVTVEPPGSQVPGFLYQHIGYVALWWVFAIFVVAFWVRLVRDELRPPRDDDAADPVPTPSPTPT